jgi:transposase/uncharacterized coiled-coil protein SlyX
MLGVPDDAGRSRGELVAENAELHCRVEELASDNAVQAKVIGELRRKITELEKRLSKDSTNSSLPPSSDRFRNKAKVESPTRAERRALGRKPGKQPGAEGKHLAQVEHPNETFVYSPPCCDNCGRDLADAPVEAIEVRQVLDTPVPKLESIEHRAETRRCRCGTKTKATFPPEARGYVSYGPRLRAVALYLMSYQHLPFERCAAALCDLFGAEVSTGFLDQLYSEGAGGLDAFMATVLDALVKSEVVHVDETFDFVMNKKAWFHVASNELYTLLHADVTRGKEGTERTGLFPSFTGTAVHDRLAQYFGYDKATHQVCCAHLIRDLASVAAIELQRPWASAMTALLIEMKLAAENARASGKHKIAKKTLAELLDRYDTLVEAALVVNPAPAGRQRDALEKESFNLAVAFRVRKDDIVRFAHDLRVPFTNNRAETDVRMVKLHLKISGPFRAMHGAERLAAVRSYLSTAAKHGLRPIEVLTALFAGEAWIPQRT